MYRLCSRFGVFALLSRMLDVEDDDLLRIGINRVINKICVFPGDDLANSLGLLKPAKPRKEDQALQALVNRGANMAGTGDSSNGDTQK